MKRNFGMSDEAFSRWLAKHDEPEGCPACGAIAGCCDQYPRCPGNAEWMERLHDATDSLEEFYTPSDAQLFLYEPQPLLDNARPIDLIATTEGHAKLMGMIERLRDGAYI